MKFCKTKKVSVKKTLMSGVLVGGAIAVPAITIAAGIGKIDPNQIDYTNQYPIGSTITLSYENASSAAAVGEKYGGVWTWKSTDKTTTLGGAALEALYSSYTFCNVQSFGGTSFKRIGNIVYADIYFGLKSGTWSATGWQSSWSIPALYIPADQGGGSTNEHIPCPAYFNNSWGGVGCSGLACYRYTDGLVWVSPAESGYKYCYGGLLTYEAKNKYTSVQADANNTWVRTN